MPVRETFGFVPAGSELILYLLFIPVVAAIGFGLYKRFISTGVASALSGSSGGIWGALMRFTQYVLIQRRVGQRPRGWPHLAIFFGFLTLLFGTTIVALDWDLFRPLGYRLLTGNRYLALEALLDALGLVFVGGLLVALIWRIVQTRRASPDQKRIQRQFITLILGLLFLGVSGFVLEALRLTIKPVDWAAWSFAGNALAGVLQNSGVANSASTLYAILWWVHAIVAFVLITMLPFSIFLHSVGAPVNIMVQSGRPRLELDTPFDLRKVQETGDFDIKVGASRLRDLDSGLQLALNACTNCGRCDEVCPAYAMGTELSPRLLMQTLRWRALDKDTDTDLLESGAISHNALWACTTCAACVEACPVLIRPMDYIVPFRRELVARQEIGKRQAEFLSNLSLSFNPYGLPVGRRADLKAELEKKAG